jgi:hypothetical protein
MVLSYQVRRRYLRDGVFYTGVQVIT